LITISLAAAFATVLFAGYLNAGGSTEPNMDPVQESLHLEACMTMKRGGDLNVSFTLLCDVSDKTVPVTEFKVNTVSQNNIYPT
jgi:hypothetical protein